MNSYKTLGELITALAALDAGEWIYVNIDTWDKNPEQARFYYISWDYIQSLDDNDVYLDDEDMEMPVAVKDQALRGWMLVSSLNHIARTKLAEREDDQWFIDEINHYREYDTFRT